MNVANLQLEGLMMAVASINNLLVHKGLLSVDDIDIALRKSEANFTGDERTYEDMPPANRDAICFPIRLLQIANNSQGESDILPFSELAKMVGQTKEPYNDQR
ncbi:hypothetical protein MesoLj113a_64920 [Mesorhizobium sp. 113-1-2]|jgi:hypothetical protein|uniref:hypothetical protein n=1 Tax=Mesorhizobium sp. 113-1-2 TaxID=2744515 RepID=UPI0008198900|nr:hypothetical protein [Mesorhizobium sp. 113-1-2]BAV50988.1 hypothetical protein MLTONO_6086 [Mesorhizobium loti]BCG75334.1 hypothetical protein MesoLj113a_64920 [Mesorhizobium sp. 113-1-2]